MSVHTAHTYRQTYVHVHVHVHILIHILMHVLIYTHINHTHTGHRSLIELEDQNVQNSIEVSKRQLIVVKWSESRGMTPGKTPSENREAWMECEQLRKAIVKNNSMKKSIAKRLRQNEREAENNRKELNDRITGEDRR